MVDPLTLMAIQAGVQGIGAIVDSSRAKKQIGKQQDLLSQASQDVGSAFASTAAQRYQVSERERQLARSGMRPTDLSPIAAQQATSLEALSTDPRALMGAVPALAQQTQQATMAAQQTDLSRELAAEGRLAGLEQQALTGNIELDRQLEQLKLQRAMGSEATAAQNIAALEAQRAGIGPSVVQGLAQTGSAIAANPNAFMAEGGRVDVISRILQEGGKTPVKKLGGEFNHDTNKKAIIDEETGVKEAEATGGEYILNPEQAGAIHSKYEMAKNKMQEGEKLSEEDLMALYEAVDEVFGQPQFNEA
tara:strand:+ start:1901 stop:2815 length:915 start_codon:yes stop_codon:yes gene_type:complete